MQISKIELANMDANKVRKSPALFASFKKYVTEDAHLLYSNGKLPQGCFGCQFNSLFQKWKNAVTTVRSNFNTQTTKKMANSKKTYQLENNAARFYFKGGVLSNSSTDEEWLEWINYPVDQKKIDFRKKQFKVLPKSSDVNTTSKEVESKKETDSNVEPAIDPQNEVEVVKEPKKTTRGRKPKQK